MVFMPLCVGGGIRTLEDIRELLLAGSDKVSINSAAPRDPFPFLATHRALANPAGCNRHEVATARCVADQAVRGDGLAARILAPMSPGRSSSSHTTRSTG